MDLKDKAKELAEKGVDLAGKGLKAGGEMAAEAGGKIKEGAVVAGKKAKEIGTDGYKKVIEEIDQTGDGKVDIEDIIILALKTPGVRVNREQFLKKELDKHASAEAIALAVETNPNNANIDDEIIEKLANDTITFERNCVSGISAALGVPGGVAMVATIPTDIAQYYGFMLRAAQKLMYLYGFPEIEIAEEGSTLDTATINMLTVCLGVMYGVAGANKAIQSMAKALGEGVSKKLINAALTKGTIYPIVKEVAKWFNVRMTKEVFAGFFKKAIPVVGGVIGGGITFVTFGPCCKKLQESLKNNYLHDPNAAQEEEIIEVEAEVVEEANETEE